MLGQARRRTQALEEARRAAEEANMAKSSFLANLSHEIRTPLNGVLANLELLTLTAVDGEQGELVGAATIAAQALFEIIGDVLDLSKIEAGKLSIETIPMVAAAVVRDLAVLVGTQASQHDLAFACHVDYAAKAAIEGDPTRLRQIVLNLAANALKFTRSGGIFLSVFRVTGDDAQIELWFEVADTGIGFAADKAETLFEAFTQEDETTSRRFGGTGLGLSICRRLAGMMGGSIHADGAPGEGATFWCRLPFRLAGAAPPEPADISGLTVMLVGADPILRHRLSGPLMGAGVAVAGAPTAEAALAAIRQADAAGRPFDLALVALEEDRRVLDLPSLLAGLPTVPVMVTAVEDVAARRRGFRHGYRHCALSSSPPADLVWSVAMASGRLGPSAGTAGRPAIDIEHLKAALAPLLGSRLLVIDDNGMNQLVARRQLAKLGFPCDVAEDGRIGLDMAVAGAYDLIFCDVQMPRMDGHSFTRLLREWEDQGRKRHVPVVAMTANAFDGDIAKCTESGMDDYVSKPVKIERMAEVLQRWLVSGGQPAGATPPVDLGTLAGLLGDDSREAHAEVLSMFLEFYPPLEGDLADAVAVADRDALRQAAHTAKGAARNGAAVPLAALLQLIEVESPVAEWSRLATLQRQAAGEYRRVAAFIADLTGSCRE